jgi:16S rRNA (uracil1498-N3)-methyltransferase
MSLATFIDPRVAQISVGATFELTGPEGRHAATVRRIRPAEHVFVTDGMGSAVRARTESVSRDGLVLTAVEVLGESAGSHHWVVVQALPKGDRADMVVDALTELGVDEICAWQAERSVVRWTGAPGKADKGVAKWSARAREAAKQSRRFRIPKVSFLNTPQVIERLQNADLVVVCHESATDSIASLQLPESGEVVFVIGPEGGISDAELAALLDAGGMPVLIARHVLRTSTAAVVALAQLQLLAQQVG